MKNTFVNVYRQLLPRGRQALLLLFLAALYSVPALADLPPVEAPPTGGGGGTYNSFIGYIKLGALALGMLVCVAAFLAVAHNVIGSFMDIKSGKGTWANFLGYLVVGVVVILIVIYLATKASEIL